MKKLVFILAALCAVSLPVRAQSPIPSYYTGAIVFNGAPTGGCQPYWLAVNTQTGHLFDCLNGSWNDIGTTGGSGTVTSVSGTTNQIDVATGTTTPVISIDTNYLLSPGPIGSGTASTGAFSTLSASSTVSGTGFSTYLASPPAIGGSAAAAGSFTTLSASSTVSGAGFSTYLASPPAIGGTSAAAGSFTTLSASSTVSGTGFTNRFASPGPIGNTSASTGAFTTLGATSLATFSGAGASATPSVTFTGTVFTGGGTTNTFPNVYLNYGAGPTTFNTNGTLLGVNGPSGFTGNFFDYHLNGGASLFSLGSTGTLTTANSIIAGGTVQIPAVANLTFAAQSKMNSPADGKMTLQNNAGTAFTILQFGGTSASFPGIQVNGTALQAELADGSAQTGFSATKYSTASNCSAAGSAASPSLVACGSASSGAFSCATNATGATCVVSTTAAVTNSDIVITQTASAGTRLSVTCNTTADTPTGPRIASISTGVSFTINLGTVSTNPTCYFFTITN